MVQWWNGWRIWILSSLLEAAANDQRWLRCHCACNAAATAGGTKPETSPPRREISRTSEEEMKPYCSAGVRNSVSTSGIRWRFMLASWNSYSKSDTARRPRSSTPPPTSSTKCASRLSKPADLDVGVVGHRLARQLDPQVQRQRRALTGALGDADDEALEQRRGAVDQVDMAVGDRVEGTGVYGDSVSGHGHSGRRQVAEV